MCVCVCVLRCYMVYPAHLIELYSCVNLTYIPLGLLKAVYPPRLLSRTYFEIAQSLHFKQLIFSC